MTLSPAVLADGIDATAAWGDAFTLVGMKFILAAVVFYILSFGLWGKARNTAVENGRWIGALLAAISIVTATTLHKTDIDLYVGGAILAVVWFAIGFFVGYVWFKFKNVKANATDIVNVKSKKDIKAFLPVIVLIGFGMVFWLFMYSGFSFSNKSASSTSIENNSTPPLQAKNHKLGSDWKWHKSNGGWLIADNGYKKNKYGLVDVWLKIDIDATAKRLGVNYSHTIVNAVFSCNDKTFKFNSITNIFDKDDIDDMADLEAYEAYKNFSKITENGNALANTYHFLCDR